MGTSLLKAHLCQVGSAAVHTSVIGLLKMPFPLDAEFLVRIFQEAISHRMDKDFGK